MANLRRSITPQQGIDAPVRRWRRGMARWPLVAIALAIGLLALAWVEGGETPLRPIAVSVNLPEQPR